MVQTEYPEIIQAIHRDFFSDIEKQDKAMRLRKLGFDNAEQAVKVNDKLEYYQNKYPLYRYITKKQVVKLCKKYNLVHGKLHEYVGFVPEKNLKEMENFQVNNEDLYEFEQAYKDDYYGGINWYTVKKEKVPNSLILKLMADPSKSYRRSFLHDRVRVTKKQFSICAPIEQFDMVNKEVNDKNEIVMLDPVVLFPVDDGYLIVTAWGNEASDPDVVNSKMN